MVAPDGPLRGSFLYQEALEFVNTFKLWMATNYEPNIRGTDEGIWRRILRIDFTREIPEEKRILNLAEKIWADESSGILNWALEGTRQWLAGGLKTPEVITKGTKAYRAEQNPIARFKREWVECDLPTNYIGSTALYEAYKRGVDCSGEYWKESHKKFSTEFEKLLTPQEKKGRDGVGRVAYYGIKLSEKATEHHLPFDNDHDSRGVEQ